MGGRRAELRNEARLSPQFLSFSKTQLATCRCIPWNLMILEPEWLNRVRGVTEQVARFGSVTRVLSLAQTLFLISIDVYQTQTCTLQRLILTKVFMYRKF